MGNTNGKWITGAEKEEINYAYKKGALQKEVEKGRDLLSIKKRKEGGANGAGGMQRTTYEPTRVKTRRSRTLIIDLEARGGRPKIQDIQPKQAEKDNSVIY